MKHCPGAGCGPKRPAFPAGVRIIDAAIDVFREKSARVWNTEGNELSVNQRVDGVAQITHRDRNISPKTKCVEPIDPGVVARLGASILHIPQLWSGELIERPAFGTMRAGCCRSVQNLALATIKTSKMAARERCPIDTIGIDIAA